jgi:hypothetical protein
MKPGHLIRRFWWAATARPLRAETRQWAHSFLLDGERRLFDAMSSADQRHHVQVARRFLERHPGPARREWTAAALLHDVGKLVSGLGLGGRVVATLVPVRRGSGRLARYHHHEEIGASMARAIGSAPDTVALIGRWPESPEAVLAALESADDL